MIHVPRCQFQQLERRLQRRLSKYGFIAQHIDPKNKEAIECSWKKFRKKDHLLCDKLYQMFHTRCAYCESETEQESGAIDHFWPKSPNSQNYQHGDPAKMFEWENLVWSCTICNGFSCKGSRMHWDILDHRHQPALGNPLLLNPCVEDPICYLEYDLEEIDTQGVLNHVSFCSVAPRDDLIDADLEKARYTIHLLRLNKRVNTLLHRRQDKISHLRRWINDLSRGVPANVQPPGGLTIAQYLTNFLSIQSPFLAPARQMLLDIHWSDNPPPGWARDLAVEWRKQGYQKIYDPLIQCIPSLANVMQDWCIPISR